MENLQLTDATRQVVSRMEHLHLGVTDLEQSIAFYRDLFGFEVRWRGPWSEGQGETAHVGTDRFYLALSTPTGGGDEGGTGRVAHLGFVTPDLPAFRRRLEQSEHGGAVYPSHRKEGEALYFFDPDGLEIEVVEYRPGYVYS